MSADDLQNVSQKNLHKSASTSISKAMLVSVAIGIAGSLIVVPLTYLQMVATLAHSYVVALTLGLWVIPCLLPQVMVKRPGASLVACGAIGVISAAATPFGMAAIPALLLEGFIIELPFLVTLYRKWSTVQCYLASVLLGGFMGFMVPITLGIVGSDFALQMGCMAISVASSLGGTWLALRIGKKIRRAGVLDD